MDLVALTAFNSVAAHGGFGRASRATGQPKATLSRRIRELEESLGLRLIERGPHSIRLMEEGAALHTRTNQLLGEIEEAAKDVSTGLPHPRGSLRVSAPVLFDHVAMGRIAAGFAAKFPEVRLEVVAEDRAVDLVTDGYDLVIRVSPRPDANLVGHRFLRDKTLVVAVPSLCRSYDENGTAVPAVVLTGAPDAAAWLVSQRGRVATMRPEPVLRLSSLVTIREAARVEAGAGLLPHSIVAEDLATGRLESLGEIANRTVEVWALHLSRRLVSPKVAATVQFLCDAFTDGTTLC